ncbi:MAG: polyprenyl synthetase family protein, partial [Ilumatobacteraceae bacterium]|nr:polyprenyl synthetase family protein [Ilumatobacteraceae bacterium]
DRLMGDAPLAAREIWHELRIELNIGQLLDLIGTSRNERRRYKTERICRYKSGKYTIERPLHLGAMLAAPERKEELLPLLSAYGLPLGDAFQMRDDVMGVFGDTALTGKPVGDDLREGKPTPLMAMAVERASHSQAKVLLKVGLDVLSDDDVRRAQEAIIDSGALAEMEELISSLTAQAIDSLEALPVLPEAKVELVALAHYVSHRHT